MRQRRGAAAHTFELWDGAFRRAERCMVDQLQTVRDNMFRESEPRQARRRSAAE